MTHLDLADVADFVRGVACREIRDRVEQHLVSGCARCRGAVALMRDVAALSRVDAGWEPPESVVRLAAAIPPPPVQCRRRLLGRLIFDSFAEPLPVGVRSADRRTRQLMYRAGGLYVDLRVDQEHGPRRVSLVGQIASAEAAGPRPADVFLVRGTRAILTAPVNEFGEFQMEYVPEPRLRLRIPLSAGEVGLEVPLARLSEPRAASDQRG